MTKDDITRQDAVDPVRAAAFAATLGRSAGSVTVGDALPPYAHHACFWDVSEEASLAPDGLPRDSDLLPDLGLPVRMWAGSRIRWHQPFRAGVKAERISRVSAVTRKEGRSGKLAFVTLRHDIRQRNAAILTEDEDIVFRETGGPANGADVASEEVEERRALKLSAVTLFRYSAVTFNAHRIHYDAGFAVDEGFLNLVVQGPLQAAHLAQFAEERTGGLRRFSCRAIAPLFLGDVAWLCRSGSKFWVEGPRRRVCMMAEAG